MPFISLTGFEAFTQHTENEHTARIGIRVSYDIPNLNVKNQTLEVIIRATG